MCIPVFVLYVEILMSKISNEFLQEMCQNILAETYQTPILYVYQNNDWMVT